MFWLDREIDYLTLPGSLLIGYLCAWIIYRDYFWGVKSVTVILGVLGIFVGICYYLIKGLDLSTVEYPCEIWDSGKYDEWVVNHNEKLKLTINIIFNNQKLNIMICLL